MATPDPTARLRFREMDSADLDDLAALLGDAGVMRYYPATKTREGAAAWIRWTQGNYARYGHGLWIIETHEGAFVGDCGLTWQQVNGVPELEVGYHVRSELHGQGYATEAATACVEFARGHSEAEALVAIIHPDNRASERVAEKLGMVRVADDLGESFPRRVLRMPLRRSPADAS
ncbi:GNAT family N-acetyltransferase [Herbiconiux sp. CPCC 203407]|uniref:GNAT family N-acetyltransferase n=1 Tax=Herbiconiux oxytropis TaxID=2970915 RepID=A0AA42BWE2_9MICO|nr:GNAT family N-acetyltransferase [Herbiconiux oxytropis]MCS5723384.1 GNAT family N-acetyltransferase [Herbiconiux oxytropis]MCS5727969.1 GNAT family N-acetyltransferase [Herbiconiux oxytropis]